MTGIPGNNPDTIIRPQGDLFKIGPGAWGVETGVRTLWMEGRNQSFPAMQAIAHAIWNRVALGRWGKTVASVCLSPMQFSGWDDHEESQRKLVGEVQDNDEHLQMCRAVFINARKEKDPTEGAISYYNPDIIKHPPPWIPQMEFAGKFGAHLFYRPKKHENPTL